MYSIKKIETKHDLNPRSSEECVRKRKKKKLKGVPGRNRRATAADTDASAPEDGGSSSDSVAHHTEAVFRYLEK